MYLLDYGLVYRFNPEGNHKEYKEDPKRKHDGTSEFTSRDAHNGVGKENDRFFWANNFQVAISLFN